MGRWVKGAASTDATRGRRSGASPASATSAVKSRDNHNNTLTLVPEFTSSLPSGMTTPINQQTLHLAKREFTWAMAHSRCEPDSTRAWFSERRNLSKRSEVANRERRAFFNTKSELQLVRESLRELSQLDASPPACARARRVIRMQANARPWTATSPVPGCETPNSSLPSWRATRCTKASPAATKLAGSDLSKFRSDLSTRSSATSMFSQPGAKLALRFRILWKRSRCGPTAHGSCGGSRAREHRPDWRAGRWCRRTCSRSKPQCGRSLTRSLTRSAWRNAR